MALGVLGGPSLANALTGSSNDGAKRDEGEVIEIERESEVEGYEYPWETPSYDSPDDWTVSGNPLASSGFGVVEPQVVASSDAYTLSVDSRIDDSAPDGLLCISMVLAPGGPTGPDGATEGSSVVCSPPTVYPQIAPFGLGGVESDTRYVYGFVRGGEAKVDVIAGESTVTAPTIVPEGFDGEISVFVAELVGDAPVQDVVPSGSPSATELGLSIPFES